jgi:hypothetical protein
MALLGFAKPSNSILKRSPGRAKPALLAGAFFWLLLLLPTPARAAEEYEIKAAFLFNFVKYVAWPERDFAAPDAPFVIGILGKDPFGKVLDQTVTGEDRKIKGRLIVVKRFGSLEEIAGCHVLFITEAEQKRWPQIAQSLAGSHVLTVGEGDRFAESGGGVIGLYKEKNRIRFVINVDAARRAELTIDSSMLNLARIVRDESR